jgi:hypothetical protein
VISDERAEKALRYLAETDEPCAAAKAEMERAEFRAKVTKQTVFLHSEGSVAERTALADTHASVEAAQDVYFRAIASYLHLANKRETERIVMDAWRTVQANRRLG